MKKYCLISLLVLILAAVLITGCGSKPTAVPTAEPTVEVVAPAAAEETTFTVEELAKFNGKDGEKAYIAVDGVVYDVTEDANWKDGAHNGFEAGKDLTEEIKSKSPHGVVKLDGLTVVGKLAD